MQGLVSFNLETMSGVFPGVRTRRYHTIWLLPEEADKEPLWAKIFWYQEADTAVVLRADGEEIARFEHSTDNNALPVLDQALEEAGWCRATCGNCHFWRQVKKSESEGWRWGRCSWRIGRDEEGSWTREREASVLVREQLELQSALALKCPHWLKREHTVAEQEPHPPSTETEETAPTGTRRRKWWQATKLYRRLVGSRVNSARHQPATDSQLEQSGLSAGTEPCVCCHDRMANLGALVTESEEGDAQTLSVWRCRDCRSTFVNLWTDRWQRLDSLETEEALYRVAPDEATLVHAQIQQAHQGGRRQACGQQNEERIWLLEFLEGRIPVVHQVRRGR